MVSWAFGIQSFVETMVFDYHPGSNIFQATTPQYSDESTIQLTSRQTLFKMIKFQQKKPCCPEATVLTAASVLSVFSEFHSSLILSSLNGNLSDRENKASVTQRCTSVYTERAWHARRWAGPDTSQHLTCLVYKLCPQNPAPVTLSFQE